MLMSKMASEVRSCDCRRDMHYEIINAASTQILCAGTALTDSSKVPVPFSSGSRKL